MVNNLDIIKDASNTKHMRSGILLSKDYKIVFIYFNVFISDDFLQVQNLGMFGLDTVFQSSDFISKVLLEEEFESSSFFLSILNPLLFLAL